MIIPLSVTSKTGKSVAVLTPKEKNMIWEQLNTTYRIRFDFLIYTAARIVEAKYIAGHPGCFRKENMAIFLPTVPGMGKPRCQVKQRTILLSEKGVAAVEEFFAHKVGFAAYQNMEQAFILAAEKAGFDKSFITTKMARKTFVSWALAVYPDQQSTIAKSAGHDVATMNNYYLAVGWRKDDIKDMKTELTGWGGNE